MSLPYEIIDGCFRRFADGREVCLSTIPGRVEYQLRTVEMAKRQNWICPLCSLRMTEEDMSFDHERPRGMGAAFRDDRIVKDGKPYNFASHMLCNGERGSRRMM